MPRLRQSPGLPLAFGHDINLDTSQEPRSPDDADSGENALRLVVPRIADPVARVAEPLAMRARLLAVATEHLRRLGPKRVTIVAVATEAGTTHPNIYRYFSSREALLDAVAERWLRDVETHLARIAEAPDPADDKIEHLLTALANIQREALTHEPHLFAVHLAATMNSRPIARRYRGRLRKLVECVVEEGISAGTFAVCDPREAATYILDASYRFTHPLAIQHHADLPRDLVDARLDAVILAIQKVLSMGRKS